MKLTRRTRRDPGRKLPDVTTGHRDAAGRLHRGGQRRKNRLAGEKVCRRIKGQRGAVVARVRPRLLAAQRTVYDKGGRSAPRNRLAEGRGEVSR